jgi:hypothetical protein
MKKIILSISIVLTACLAIAQQQDSVGQDHYSIEAFQALVVKGVSLDVHLRQSDSCYYQLETESDRDYLTIETRQDTLFVTATPDFKGDLFVGVQELKYLNVQDVVDVKTKQALLTDHFVLETSGTTDIRLQLEVKSLKTIVHGASDIKLSGTADEHYLTVVGAADVDAKDLQSKTLQVDISGAGDVEVSVAEKISGDISGAAELSFHGDPNVDDISVSGAAVFKGKGANQTVVGNDTVTVNIGGYNLNIFENNNKGKKKKKSQEYKPWAGIGIGVNGFLNASNSFDLPANYDFLKLNYGKSIGVELNLFEKDIAIIGEYLQLVTGIGFDFANYKFASNTRLIDNADSIFGYVDTIHVYNKTKLATSFITLPLLVEINTGADPKKALHLSAGLLLGYNLGARTKVVYHDNNEKKKIKEKGTYNINPFRYGVTARIGVGEDVAIFANYALSPLFKNGEGPEMYPFTMGLELLFN